MTKRKQPGPKAPRTAKRETLEWVEIPLPISSEQLARHTLEWGAVSRNLDQHADDKREYLSQWRERHKELKAKHDELRSIVQDKSAPRRVKAITVVDFDKKEVRFLEPGTRKLLHTRKLTDEDRQLGIEGTAPERTGGAHVSDKPPRGEEGKPVRGTVKRSDVESPRPALAAVPEDDAADEDEDEDGEEVAE